MTVFLSALTRGALRNARYISVIVGNPGLLPVKNRKTRQGVLTKISPVRGKLNR